MKKAIGGLLVVSMLSTPQPIDLNYIAYLALKNNNRVVYVQYVKDADRPAEPGDIDQAMAGMEVNSRMITNLLKDRAETLSRMEAKMDILSYAKVALNDEQITGYSAFMSNYRENAQELNGLMKTMDGEKSLTAAQREIMSEDTDYTIVMNQLGTIIDAQNLAIDNLTSTISEGKQLLEAL